MSRSVDRIAASAQRRRKPGPRRSLSLEPIAAAALRIADEEGLEALTMKRLAVELDVGVMTLYSYVRTKDEILDALTDLALSELELPDTGAWHEQLAQLFTNLHALLVAHPSVARIEAIRPLVGPAALRAADRGLGLLAEGGLDLDAAFIAHRALTSYTVGTALFHISRSTTAGEDALRERSAQIRYLTTHNYPHVAEHLARFESEHSPSQLQREFDFGIEQLIAGIRSIGA